MYEEIFDKNIQQQWGVYVHGAFYFTLDFNLMDTCMHSRIRTPATLLRARAGPRKKEVVEEGAKGVVVGNIETASLEERVPHETPEPAGCVTAPCMPWTKPRVGM